MDRFELSIQRGRPGFPGSWPVVSKWMRADGSPTAVEYGSFAIDLAAVRASAPKSYGTTLGQALFTGDIALAFGRAVAAAERVHVLLNLEVDDDQLKRQHWQRLCAPLDKGWRPLSLDQRTPFSLYIPSPIDSRFPPFRRDALRAIVLAASPPGLEDYRLRPFDVAETVGYVRTALAETPCDVLADLPDAAGPPTLDALCTQITARQYPLLHIICHGAVVEPSENGPRERQTLLFLAKADGSTDPVEASRLIDRLKNLHSDPGLPHVTFIAACQSAGPTAEAAYGGMAERLVRELGMPAVLAMTDRVSIATANDLAAAFYRRLREHGEVDLALNEAGAGLAERHDIVVPALYSRLGTRSLFSSNEAIRIPTSDDIARGLTTLDELIRDRAPVLSDRFAIPAATVRRSLGSDPATLSDQARAERAAALKEIEALSLEIVEVEFSALAFGNPPPAYDSRCPFRGLESFSEGDASFFFGRDQLVKNLAGKLASHPFLAVVGQSGSGKSSVVRAGLLPALHLAEPGLTTIVLRPGADPPAELAARVAEDSTGPLLIVVDQFEEVFDSPDEEKRRAFIDRLFALNLKHRVVITMRADVVGECAAYPQLKSAVQDHQELIGPMSEADLRRAMDFQARTVGLDFDAGLEDTILLELHGEPGAMSLLQYTLLRLWERRHGYWLRAEEYERIGRVRGAVAQRAEEIYCALDADPDCERLTDGRLRARDAFIRLTRLTSDDGDVAPRDTRRRVRFADLVPDGESPAATEAVIDRLVAASLLVTSTEPKPRGAVDGAAGDNGADVVLVELAHESLIRFWPRLQRWLEGNRADWRLRQDIGQAARNWRDAKQDPSYLFRGRLLDDAETLKERGQVTLNAEEQDFVRASAQLRADEETKRLAEQTKRRRLTTGIIAVTSVSAVILGLLSWWAFGQWHRAEDQTDTARSALSRQLAATAQNIQLDDFSLSQLLSLEALSFADTVEARSSLLDGLTKQVGLTTFLRGHASEVDKVAFVPGQNIVVSHDVAGNIIFWDLSNNQPIGLPVSAPGRETVDLAFDRDAHRFAVADVSGRIQLWNLDTHQAALAAPLDHGDELAAVAFGPDDTTVVSAGTDGRVLVWNASTGQVITEQHLGTTNAVRVVLNRNGTLVALGTEDGQITLWDLQNPTSPAVRRVLDLATVGPNADTSELASPVAAFAGGGGDNDVVEMLQAAAFAADGTHFVAVSDELWLTMWNLESGDHQSVNIDQGGFDVAESVSVVPDGSTVAVGLDSGTAVVWRPFETSRNRQRSVFTTRAERRCEDVGVPLQGADGAPRASSSSVAVSSDGQTLAATNPSETHCAIAVWSLTGRSSLSRRVADQVPGLLPAARLAFRADNTIMASAGCVAKDAFDPCSVAEIRLWQVDDGQATGAPLATGTDRITSLAFGADEMLVAGGCADATEDECPQGMIRLWDTDRGVPIGEALVGHATWVTAVAASADGKTVASAGKDGTIAVWTGVQGKPRLAVQLAAHTAPITSLAFSFDGTLLASGSEDETVKIWNLDLSDPKSRVVTLVGHVGSVTSVAFSPDQTIIATGSSDRTVILWSVATGQRLLRPLQHGAPVLDIAFSGDGRTLAVANQYQGIALWDIESRQVIRQITEAGDVYAVAFAQKRDLLASSGASGGITIWEMNPKVWQTQACAVVARNLVWSEWLRYLPDYPYHLTCPKVAPALVELLRQADTDLLAGDRSNAETEFNRLVETVAASGDAALNHDLCWTGSFDRVATIVMPSCNRAIALQPTNPAYYDARAVARVLTGDTDGAIADFTYVIDHVGRLQRRELRQRWVDDLRAGRNPFDDATLDALRNEVPEPNFGQA